MCISGTAAKGLFPCDYIQTRKCWDKYSERLSVLKLCVLPLGNMTIEEQYYKIGYGRMGKCPMRDSVTDMSVTEGE